MESENHASFYDYAILQVYYHYSMGNGNSPHTQHFRHVQTSFFPLLSSLCFWRKSCLLCFSNVIKRRTMERETMKHTCFGFIISYLNSLQNNCLFQLPKIKSRPLIAKKQSVKKMKIKTRLIHKNEETLYNKNSL